ncbi:MAG: hypothetical protein AB1798_04295 [Spirochaetota bacterium]
MVPRKTCWKLFCICIVGVIPAIPVMLKAADPAGTQAPFKGWKQFKTEHFIIIFEEKDWEAAKEVYTFCEEVYSEVTGYFGYYPKTVPCVIKSRIDTASGSFSGFPAHITLYVTSPSGPWMGSKTENWLKIVLTHEFTHFVHRTYGKGLFAFLSKVFGREIKPLDSLFLPGWMTEGITTNLETLFTEGGRGRNPFFELYYKAPLMENKLFSLNQAAYSSSFPPSGRIYVGGYILVHYLMKQYGNAVFKRINAEYVKFPFFGPWAAIKKVTGKTASELYSAMEYELLQEYRLDKLIEDGTRVSPAKIGDYYLPVITDQGWYLYRETLNFEPAIVRYNPETQQEEVLIRVILTDPASFTASKAGGMVVFASPVIDGTHPAGISHYSDLYSMDTVTGKIKQITKNAHLWQPALSPDGKTLIAVQGFKSYSRLIKMNLEDGNLELLFALKESTVYNPVFSPDGKRIAFAMNVRGMQDIWLLDFDGSTTQPLTDSSPETFNLHKSHPVTGPDASGDYYPQFSDSGTILFGSDREGSLSIYQYDLNKNTLSRICRDPVGAYAGLMTENSVVYASYSTDGFCLKRKRSDSLIEKPVAISHPENLPDNYVWKIPGYKNNGKYHDFPRFIFWLPVPFYINTISPGVPIFGAGIVTFANSILGTSNISAAISSRFDVLQPGFDISIDFPLWKILSRYTVSQAYIQDTDSYYRQITRQFLSVSLPLLARYKLGSIDSFSIFTGLQHQYFMSNSEPFPFMGKFRFENFSTGNQITAAAGFSFSHTRSGAPMDFHSPFGILLSLTGAFPIPVFQNSIVGVQTYWTFSFSFPSPIQHQVVKLGLKGAFISENSGGYQTIVPRGLFDPVPREGPVRLLGALDYLFSIALLDIPLPLNFNFQGLSGGFHVEYGATLGRAQPFFKFDDDIYPGFELAFLAGFSGAAPVALGIGLSFKVDKSFSKPLDPYKDIRPYFFIGFDSFTYSMHSRFYAYTAQGRNRQ